MEISDYQTWLTEFYHQRGWYELSPFIRVNFLTEETGEVSRAIRALEIGRDRPDEHIKSERELKNDLTEELGDVLDNLLILASKYDISLTEIMQQHQIKLLDRFPD